MCPGKAIGDSVLGFYTDRGVGQWLGIALEILSRYICLESEMLEVAFHQAHQQFVIRSQSSRGSEDGLSTGTERG